MFKYAFVTCVELGLACIEEIYKNNIKLDLIITLEDHLAKNKSGRVYLDKFAKDQKISLLKVKNINCIDVKKIIEEFSIDYLLIIGWSQIVTEEIISLSKKGAYGIHPTLLPKGRGRASIPWAILKKLPETGVTLFKLDSGVDTGPILYQKKIILSNSIDATFLYGEVLKAHLMLIKKFCIDSRNDTLKEYPQNDTEASYWEGRKPLDGKIDLNKSVYDAEILVRATTKPYPGAYYFENGSKIIVWKAFVSSKKMSGFKVLPFVDGYLVLEDYEKTY